MVQTYKSKEWFDFRSRLIRLRASTCEQCGKAPPMHVVFQIHHLTYKQDSFPWQYDDDEVMLVCKGCHAKLHGRIQPTSGWQLDYEDDLGSQDGECDCCGREIRYAFYVSHEDWPSLTVGSGCCDRLTESSEGSYRKAFFERLARFSNSKCWTESGNSFSRTYKGFGVTVMYLSGKWMLKISSRKGSIQYESRREAEKAALKRIEQHLFKVYKNGIHLTLAAR